MSERAALVSGASRGIGLALAEALIADGYAVTLTARRPEPLAAVAERLSGTGADVAYLAGDIADEATLQAVVDLHRTRFGRLDVLVNNAGFGKGAAAGEHETKFVDMQLGINLRSLVLMYRECAEMLLADGGAQVINLSSISGVSPQAWLSVYSATKAAVLAYTVAMNQELATHGVRSTAIAPAFVDTDMSAFVHDTVKPEEMISTADIVAAMRFVLTLSPAALVPEIVIARPGETL